jgi:septal ring factor EnvC (AmiA/AmiB activator)
VRGTLAAVTAELERERERTRALEDRVHGQIGELAALGLEKQRLAEALARAGEGVPQKSETEGKAAPRGASDYARRKVMGVNRGYTTGRKAGASHQAQAVPMPELRQEGPDAVEAHALRRTKSRLSVLPTPGEQADLGANIFGLSVDI